jgi:hypothetical protein
MDRFNVASLAGLPGLVDQTYQRFKKAGFPYEWLPDDQGYMPVEATSGFVIGRIGIRDELGETVESLTNRDAPYSNQQRRNLVREGGVMEKCKWPVESTPFIAQPSLQAVATNLAASKNRRNRGNVFADVSSAQAF